MKSLLNLFVLVGFISLFANPASAQGEIGARSIAMDDGAGHVVDIVLPGGITGGPYTWTLPITTNGLNTSIVLPGASNGQTLFWNNSNGYWQNSSVLTNDGIDQVGFTGQLTGTSSNSSYTASISNTNASSFSALTVNQNSSTLPNNSFYNSAAIVAAGTTYGLVGTASQASSSGAGVYGAADDLSGNNIWYSPGAGVEGVSFSGSAGVVAANSGGTGDALYAFTFFGSGNAGHFEGPVLMNGDVTAGGHLYSTTGIGTVSSTGSIGGVSATGTDVSGVISYSGTSGYVNCTITVNYGYTYSTAPVVIITPANSDAAHDFGADAAYWAITPYVTCNASNFVVNFIDYWGGNGQINYTVIH